MKRFFITLINPFASNLTMNDNGTINSNESVWVRVRKQFVKNRLALAAFRIIIFISIIALFADFIANEKPLVAQKDGVVYFPVFKSYAVDLGLSSWPTQFQNVVWQKMEFEWAIYPPVPYLPKNLDENNIHSVSPFDVQNVKSIRWRHWFGTDELGRDVLSAMIHGTRIALLVGLVSMSIAALIGVCLGSMAGYYGDNRLRMTRGRALMNFVFILLALFYGFGSRSYILSDALTNSPGSFFIQLLLSIAIVILVVFVGNVLSWPFNFIPFLNKKITIPVDIIISRLIEVMVSIPTLFLIISVSALVTRPSIFMVMGIIGLTGWTGIARFMRAELLRVRNLEYIEAAHALGFGEFRTIVKHAIPNALSPVLVSIAFGIAAAILIESTLSFLGIGVPAETLTWGSLLSMARQSPTAWWLAVFPGLAIFITVTVYNLVGEGLTDALDPRLRK